jgi:hypothetical protein
MVTGKEIGLIKNLRQLKNSPCRRVFLYLDMLVTAGGVRLNTIPIGGLRHALGAARRKQA